MSKQILAIALCRVSTVEQLESNSLNRQRDAVMKAANELGVLIPDDGWWSGSVSSKRGTNIYRKDLQEMIDRCKRDKRIKYVIVDEPDRFMRSIDEAAFFEVSFRQLGVTVWYASDPELNKGDLASKLLKFTKYLSAEGSNEERQNKSIAGQTKALLEGRYPFSPKPGYRKGQSKAIQDVDSIRGPILKLILERVAGRLVTPSQALVELNRSDFVVNHSLYRMDKFRNILIDPFYAGVVEVDKQVKARNENGLHEPLITLKQNQELIRIMNDKEKTQSGPRKNGNPKYPLSNLVSCSACTDRTNGRFVGFDHSNGKPGGPIYEKYRCRACKRYITRQELHQQVSEQFTGNLLTTDGLVALEKALDKVWKEEEGQTQQEVIRLKAKIKTINEDISNQVQAATDPTNASIKPEILILIEKRKNELYDLEVQLDNTDTKADTDKKEFLGFAFDFIQDMGSKFFEISRENRLRCKQLVFPAGFYVDENKKVYTPETSILYRLATKKKGTVAPNNSHLVRVTGL